MSDNDIVSCPIRSDGGPLTITLRASNALLSGSDFSVWGTDGETELESWKLSAGVAGSGDHELRSAASSLDGCFVTWEVRVCSPMAAIETGAVEILVSQDGIPCLLTRRLFWELEAVPLCETGDVMAITSGLAFRNR